MKRVKSYNHSYSFVGGYLSFLILLMACGNDGDLIPTNCDVPRAADSYVYPVVPGMPEWRNLDTADKKWEACQIPANQLESMSTAGLIDSWEDFPLTFELFLSNSFQFAIEFHVRNFSGLQELSRRNDAGTELMARYQQMKPACVATYEEEMKRGSFTLGFVPIELLLAQDIILDKLSPPQKKRLLSEALSKYRLKQRYHDDFGTRGGTAISLFLCVRILKHAGFNPFIREFDREESLIIRILYETGVLYLNPDAPDSPEIRTIVRHAENLLNRI
ncbi:MAG: hypothetical protein JJU34_10165 [Lunatimonas sp.]|uniref:hypothetical protein n=1 Tax=Lunatimonas sp. TaxID=2060141 RepID=UPI00263B3F5A|nr:hypothetical protein [Lunatimonas sp.]MCC5937637.1 hypothetical protein [Lunatimonas sp.]